MLIVYQKISSMDTFMFVICLVENKFICKKNIILKNEKCNKIIFPHDALFIINIGTPSHDHAMRKMTNK